MQGPALQATSSNPVSATSEAASVWAVRCWRSDPGVGAMEQNVEQSSRVPLRRKPCSAGLPRSCVPVWVTAWRHPRTPDCCPRSSSEWIGVEAFTRSVGTASWLVARCREPLRGPAPHVTAVFSVLRRTAPKLWRGPIASPPGRLCRCPETAGCFVARRLFASRHVVGCSIRGSHAGPKPRVKRLGDRAGSGFGSALRVRRVSRVTP